VLKHITTQKYDYQFISHFSLTGITEKLKLQQPPQSKKQFVSLTNLEAYREHHNSHSG